MAPDINDGGGSRIANRNRGIGGQQLPAPGASTLTPWYEGDNAGELQSAVVIGADVYPPSRQHRNGEDVHTGAPWMRGAGNSVATFPISALLRGVQRFVIRGSTKTRVRVFNNLRRSVLNARSTVVRMAGTLMT